MCRENSREAAASQSPGLAALFAAYPGNRCNDAVYPERVESGCNPFRVEIETNPIPRVERQRTPLNPGLCDEAPIGAFEIRNAYRNGSAFATCTARGGGLP